MILILTKLVPLRQIHHSHGEATPQPVAERLPLWREGREGVENRVTGLVGGVDEQGHWRAHLRVSQQRQHRLGVGRPLHQYGVGREIFQRPTQAAR